MTRPRTLRGHEPAFLRRFGPQSVIHTEDMFSSTMSAIDFLWVGAWPSYREMGAGFEDFFNGEEGAAAFEKWLEISSCEQHVLFSSTQVRENLGD